MQNQDIFAIPLVVDIDCAFSSSMSTLGMNGCPGEEIHQRTPSALDTTNPTRRRRRRMSAFLSSELETSNVHGKKNSRRSSWIANAPAKTVTFKKVQSMQASNYSSQQPDDVSLSLNDLYSSSTRSSSREYVSKLSLMEKDELHRIFAPKKLSTFVLSASQRHVFQTEEYKKIKAQVQRNELQDLVMSAMQLLS